MADDNKTTEKKLTGAAAKAAAAKAGKEAPASGDRNPETTGGQQAPEAASKGGAKAKKPAAKTVTRKTPDNPSGDPAKAPTEDKFEALAKRYAKAYPKCKAFHITSDGQVFLENDLDAARFHQNGIGTGELKTITMK